VSILNEKSLGRKAKLIRNEISMFGWILQTTSDSRRSRDESIVINDVITGLFRYGKGILMENI
jgi:hypothetical protein